MTDKQEAFWKKCTQTLKLDSNTKCKECFSFGYTKELIDELTELVLKGQKTATASSVLAYETEADQPHVGDYSMVVNYEEEPVAIIKTIDIKILPFNEVSWEFAKLEGEDDNLESWRRNHRKFFTEEAIRLNYQFSEEMLVISEKFKVLIINH